MSYYFFAQIRMNDLQEYQKYLDEADSIFKQYKGKYLVVDNDPKVIEGNWDYTRAVLIEFPSEDTFYEWYNSADYQRILKHRIKAAHCDSILLKGK